MGKLRAGFVPSTFQSRASRIHRAAIGWIVFYFFAAPAVWHLNPYWNFATSNDWTFLATRTTIYETAILKQGLRFGIVPGLIVPLLCLTLSAVLAQLSPGPLLMKTTWFRIRYVLCAILWAAGIAFTLVQINQFASDITRQWVFSLWTPSSNFPSLHNYMTVTPGAYVALGLMGVGLLSSLALLLSRHKKVLHIDDRSYVFREVESRGPLPPDCKDRL